MFISVQACMCILYVYVCVWKSKRERYRGITQDSKKDLRYKRRETAHTQGWCLLLSAVQCTLSMLCFVSNCFLFAKWTTLPWRRQLQTAVSVMIMTMLIYNNIIIVRNVALRKRESSPEQTLTSYSLWHYQQGRLGHPCWNGIEVPPEAAVLYAVSTY